MTTLRDSPSRDEVLQFISAAASYGNLGLFIGAGLSKAVLNDVNEIALSWGQLLEQASITLGVDYAAIRKDGASYPEIASLICQEYQTAKGVSFARALRKLKDSIAELTCWYPDQEKRESFGRYLDGLFQPGSLLLITI